MAKKDFKKNKKNTAELFTRAADEPQEALQQTQECLTIPKGYKLVKETKSERMRLQVRPTLKKDAKQCAEALGFSMNEFANRGLDFAIRTAEFLIRTLGENILDNNGCELDKRRGEYCSSCDNYDKANHYCPYYCDVIKDAIKDLNDFRGHWKISRGRDSAESDYTCSVCGWNDRLKTFYCAHCGAKMENGIE